MQYLGGKAKLAKKLVPIMRSIVGNRPFLDPFCGGLSISLELAKQSNGFIADVNPALMYLYQAIRDGWIPPDAVSESEYYAARSLPDEDPRKGFIGFGLSFGGKWFGGYARDGKGRDYCGPAKRALLRDMPKLNGCLLGLGSFDKWTISPNYFVYCDPPYIGTTGYRSVFDHEAFYRRVLEWASVTTVFVSEYTMPFGRVVGEFQHFNSVGADPSKARPIEKLYMVGG